MADFYFIFLKFFLENPAVPHRRPRTTTGQPPALPHPHEEARHRDRHTPEDRIERGHLIFNPGSSGFTSTSSSSLTIESVPCLYFRKCGVCRWLS